MSMRSARSCDCCAIRWCEHSARHLTILRTHLLRQRLRSIIDPGNEPALFSLVDMNDAGPTEVLDELGQSDPARSVHVRMVLVLNELLVAVRARSKSGQHSSSLGLCPHAHLIGPDPLRTPSSRQEV